MENTVEHGKHKATVQGSNCDESSFRLIYMRSVTGRFVKASDSVSVRERETVTYARVSSWTFVADQRQRVYEKQEKTPNQ